MKDDGIDLFSKEGMGFVASGVMLVVLFVMLNRAFKTEKNTGPSGAIGVRG